MFPAAQLARSVAEFTQALHVCSRQVTTGENADHARCIVALEHDQAADIGFDHLIGGFARAMVFADADDRAGDQ